MKPEPLFEICAAKCGYGEVRTDGKLGYDCELTGGRVLGRQAEEVEFISAHAPSRVELVLHRPARVQGFLNATARWMPENPAVFLVNENPPGLAHGPLEESLPLTLGPGRHVLRAVCQNLNSRHTVWRLEPAAHYTPPRLALVTIGCYPEAESWKPLWHLCQSAVRMDRWLHVMGVGTPYRNHYEAKVVRLREFIAGLEAEYVLYTDGKDSILTGGEEEILAEFAKLETDFVISMERGCWPIFDRQWRESFPAAVEERRWPNGGGWMGTKAGVLRVLERCLELREAAQQGRLPGSLAVWSRLARQFVWDDQALLQLCYLEGMFSGDTECRIFTNVGTADRRLAGNAHYQIVTGRTRVRQTGALPAVVHFSGPACHAAGDQWAAALELRRDFTGPPVPHPVQPSDIKPSLVAAPRPSARPPLRSGFAA